MRRQVAVVLVTFPLGACSPNDVTEPCSTGDPYGPGATFPFVHGAAGHPACTPHCGDVPLETLADGGVVPTSAALPSGPCVHVGNACAMTASLLSACGAVSVFACRCTALGWSCAIDEDEFADAGCSDGGDD